jgi:hypothetical protein
MLSHFSLKRCSVIPQCSVISTAAVLKHSLLLQRIGPLSHFVKWSSEGMGTRGGSWLGRGGAWSGGSLWLSSGGTRLRRAQLGRARGRSSGSVVGWIVRTRGPGPSPWWYILSPGWWNRGQSHRPTGPTNQPSHLAPARLLARVTEPCSRVIEQLPRALAWVASRSHASRPTREPHGSYSKEWLMKSW